jgi:hypothetical protein
MHRSFPFALIGSALLLAPAAAAEELEWDGAFSERAERRSDFVAGVGLGLAVGNAVGYPNQAGKIGDPEYEADTGFAVGYDALVWIGGARKDWFTVGLGFTSAELAGNDLVAPGWAFVLRVETYPLFYQGGFWQDFGLYAHFGAGSVTIRDQEEQEQVANGGALSLVGIGSVYEAVRFGGLATGPTLEYRYLYSASLDQHAAVLGWRVLYYTGP